MTYTVHHARVSWLLWSSEILTAHVSAETKPFGIMASCSSPIAATLQYPAPASSTRCRKRNESAYSHPSAWLAPAIFFLSFTRVWRQTWWLRIQQPCFMRGLQPMVFLLGRTSTCWCLLRILTWYRDNLGYQDSTTMISSYHPMPQCHGAFFPKQSGQWPVETQFGKTAMPPISIFNKKII